MKILITGGAGFIGSAFIRYIIKNTSHDVINVDCLTYAGNLESLRMISTDPKYHFEQVDICSKKEIQRVFSTYKPDAVLHLAAESHVDKSIEGPWNFIKTNIIGTYNLLQESLDYWRCLDPIKQTTFRFHHVSTDEVFGDLDSPDKYFEETTAYAPSSPYSASKASSDHLVRAWHRTYGLPVLITNCSNNYGPYQYPEKLIPRVISNALAFKSLPIYGNGKQIRDWLYVDDHVKALYLVLTKGVVGSTYNIGGNSEKENIAVVQSICNIMDELVPLKNQPFVHYSDLIEYVQDRPGHDVRYAINSNKIKTELGWSPEMNFEKGIRITVEWYLQNQDWLKPVITSTKPYLNDYENMSKL